MSSITDTIDSWIRQVEESMDAMSSALEQVSNHYEHMNEGELLDIRRHMRNVMTFILRINEFMDEEQDRITPMYRRLKTHILRMYTGRLRSMLTMIQSYIMLHYEVMEYESIE